MVHRAELEDSVNAVIRNFIDIDDFWQKYAPNCERGTELPKVSVWIQSIPWGGGKDRVQSECVTLCATRPMCLLMKNIVSESRDLFPYEFVESGHAAMNSHIKYKDVLVANNVFQNAVQGISIVGVSRTAMSSSLTRAGKTQEIREWILDHPGTEYVEPTDDTDKDGRWIVVVLRDEFDNVKAWLERVLTEIPNLLTEDEKQRCQTDFDIFPPCLHIKAPLGGKMQQGSEESYTRIMNNSRRYSDSSSKPTTKTWKKPPRFYFDSANSTHFPALSTKKSSSKPAPTEPGDTASTSSNRSSPTKTAHTTSSTDMDTIVSRFDTVASEFSQALERIMKDNNEKQTETNSRIDLLLQESKEEKTSSASRHEDITQGIGTIVTQFLTQQAELKRESEDRFSQILQATTTANRDANKELLQMIMTFTQNQSSQQSFQYPPYPNNFFPSDPNLLPPYTHPFNPPLSSIPPLLVSPPYGPYPGPGFPPQFHPFAPGFPPINSTPVLQQDLAPPPPPEMVTGFNPISPALDTTLALAGQSTLPTHPLSNLHNTETTQPMLPTYSAATPTSPPRLPLDSTEFAGQRRRHDQISATPEKATNPTPPHEDVNDTARNICFEAPPPSPPALPLPDPNLAQSPFDLSQGSSTPNDTDQLPASCAPPLLDTYMPDVDAPSDVSPSPADPNTQP